MEQPHRLFLHYWYEIGRYISMPRASARLEFYTQIFNHIKTALGIIFPSLLGKHPITSYNTYLLARWQHLNIILRVIFSMPILLSV